LAVTGCPKKPIGNLTGGPELGEPNYDRPLPDGALALRKLGDAEFPDLTNACADATGLPESIQHSLNYMAKPSSQKAFPYGQITHAQAVASLRVMNDLVRQYGASPATLNAAVRQRFDAYISVGCDDKGTVLYTGYYTPIFNASPQRTAQFRWPLYKMPADLVKGPDGTTLGRRGAGGQTERYPDRRIIESTNMLAGAELYWLADPFEVYVAHVQGSAKLRLADGRLVTVGYTANNGYEYNSVGKALVADGRIAAKDLSLHALIRYFKAHPGQVQEYTWRNPRFVFFAEERGEPRGCLNEPVTSMRTIATDKTAFPRACLAVISTSLPMPRIDGSTDYAAYQGFALDQDAGGAIRAAGRCDVYMGVGDAAGRRAGHTRQEGKLYYLFLKPQMVPAASVVPTAGPAPTPTP
jgi:membrane-bound lytic murein transglycosylase A